MKFRIRNKTTSQNASASKHADAKRATIALCGNPNSGKTTLFNALTGGNQKVGNWPGVTVEQKRGICKAHPQAEIIDTPGVYSLSPFTPEEQVTQNFLKSGDADVVINVVDTTSLARSLFLTDQLLTFGTPIVVALNMQDEAKAKGIEVDAQKLSKRLGCKVFCISAAKKQGLAELCDYCAAAAINAAKDKDRTARNTSDACHINATADEAEKRYKKIDRIVAEVQTEISADKKIQRARNITQKIDAVVLNKWLAFPIFALIMTAVFFLSVDGLGGFLTELISDKLTPALQSAVGNLIGDDPAWLRSLVVDGVIAGVMSVVGFLPQVMLLFGCIAVLEASGYMSRIAFITDRLLNKIGLGGRSFVSMILGCGCSVPAIMSCRTIKNEKERIATATLVPFMPCSAKLAVISFFCTYVLDGNALFAISFYFLSIGAVILGGLIWKVLFGDKNGDTFFMELPTYRAPTLGNVWRQMWERGKAFLAKAGTIIFAASVVLWVLTNFSWSFMFVEPDDSILASIGKAVAPLFYPLGWNDCGCGWQFAISSISGFAAKETVVTTLQILLPQGVDGAISHVGVYSFVAYNLLTIPCVAAVSASFVEQGAKGGLISAAFQAIVAYSVSLAIYQIGTLAQMYTPAFVATITCALLAVSVFFAVRYAVRHRRCTGCDACGICNKKCGK